MNKQQLAAAIAAAEAELARLQAIVPEPEVPLMVLSAERVPQGSEYYAILFSGVVREIVDDNKAVDILAHEAAAYYSSEEQAEAYARAFRTLRLIRCQPGVIAANAACKSDAHVIAVYASQCAVYHVSGASGHPYLFPYFGSREAAYAAVAAVGEEELAFCANFLAGNITMSDYVAAQQQYARQPQNTQQTGEQK